MSLESVVGKLMKRNPQLKDIMGGRQGARSTLMGIVAESYEKNKSLVNWSRFTDKLNFILGPLEAGLRYFSPLGSVGFGVYSLAKLLHYGLVKLPYAAYYTLKTGDLKGALSTSLAEVAKYVLPFGTLGDVFPLYKKTMDNYIVRDTEKRLEDLLKRPARATADLRMPAGLTAYNPQVRRGRLYVDAPSEGYEALTHPLGDGIHEVYLRRKKGLHPNIQTRLRMLLPKGLRKLQLNKRGFIKKRLRAA